MKQQKQKKRGEKNKEAGVTSTQLRMSTNLRQIRMSINTRTVKKEKGLSKEFIASK